MSRNGIESEGRTNLEELQRIIDNQIKSKERVQKKALSVIRLEVAIVGILASAFVTLSINSGLSNVIPVFELNDMKNITREIINSISFLDSDHGELFIILNGILLIAVSYSTLYYLLYATSKSAYLVLKPDRFKSSPKLDNIVDKYTSESYLGNSLAERYEKLIQKNESALDTMYENWELCYGSARKGINSFIILAGYYFLINVAQNTVLFVIFFSLTVIMSMNSAFNKISREQLEPIFTTSYIHDIGLMMGILGMIASGEFNNEMDIISHIAVAGVIVSLVIAMSLYIKNSDFILIYTTRNISIGIMTIILYLFVLIGFPDRINTGGIAATSAIAIVLGFVIYSAIGILALGGKVGYELTEKKSKNITKKIINYLN